MRKYGGQSLAIVFAILIIASVIGFALYARMARDSERVVDERASIEANELSETVVGLISTSDYDSLQSDCVFEILGCERGDLRGDGCRMSNLNLSDLEEFLRCLGIEGIDLSDFDFDEGYCSVELAMRYLRSDEGIDIPKDYAHSFFLYRVDWDSCDRVNFQMNNEGAKGFVMSSFYGNVDGGEVTSLRMYEMDDVEGFLYSGSGSNWSSYTSGSSLSFPSDYPASKDGYGVYEVRFKSLGGVSNLTWSTSGNCDMRDALSFEVGATCGGQYIGKTFVVPGDMFTHPVFDYVFYGGEGNLSLD